MVPPETTEARICGLQRDREAGKPLYPVVRQVRAVNVEKLYPGARARAHEHFEFSAMGAGLLPSGEALPAFGPASPLGIYAKSITPPPSVRGFPKKSETASVGADSAAAKKETARKSIQATRAQRYALLATARRIISAAGYRAGLQYAHDFHRTAKCKFIRHGGEFVGVHHAKAHGSAFFSSLVTCGSMSACPVCANKVGERRREEIAKAVDWTYAQGLQPVMVTLTFPHRAWHKLRELLAQQAKALQRLRAGQPWAKFKARIGFRGLIRGLECTHGASGWHPHTHEIWMVAKDSDAEAMKVEIIKRWESACARAGLLDLDDSDQLKAFKLYAVDVKGNCSASDYLSKQDDSRHWGVDRELAKGCTKAGKAKGLHPFGLLALAGDGDRRAARLYLAYIMAMKGKRLLFWSHGLKAEVGVDDLSDETLTEQEREAADLLGHLTDDDWQTVRDAGKRAAVLDAAESGGWPAVEALLERLTAAAIARLEALLMHPAGNASRMQV